MNKSLIFFILSPILIHSQQDTTQIGWDNEDNYNTKWLSVGGNFDVVNSLTGFNFSNGFDEEPLIHFEDFQENLIGKIEGQTNFDNDYSFQGGIGILYPIKFISRAELRYSTMNISQSDFNFQRLFLQFRSYYLGDTAIILRTGIQELGDNRNYGFEVGFEHNFKHFYIGANGGYYKEYYTFNGYFQVVLLSDQLNLFSLRIEYAEIEFQSILNVGIRWSFVRK